MADDSRRLVSIQYLRGIASVMVTMHHALAGVGGDVPVPALLGGVDIFFVISGFIIWTATSGRAVSPGGFLWRRAARVVPAYWIVTTLMVAVLVAAPGLMRTARFDVAHVAASYLFIPWPHPQPGLGIFPVLVPGWTLNYEMFFYVVVAAVLFAPARVRAALILGVLAGLAMVGLAVPGLPLIARFYSSPIILEFALGVAIALVAGRAHGPWAGPALIGAGIVGLVVLAAGEPWGGERLLRLGIPAAMIVGGAVLCERAGIVPVLRPGLLLGDASYALYLTHTLVLAALGVAWRRAGLDGHQAAFAAIGVAASIAVAIALHVLAERRLMAVFARPRPVPGTA